MDHGFSRYAIASIFLATLVPIEIYANAHGILKALPDSVPVVIMIATPLGAVVLGHIARGQVRRSGYIRGGYGVGSAGMLLGYLILVTFAYLYLKLSMTPRF
jgi:hypothetical protein